MGFPPRPHLLVNFALAGIFASSTSVVFVQPVQAASLLDWRFDPNTNQLQMLLNDGTIPRYSVLDQPARIAIDLPNTKLGNVVTRQVYSGAVQQIRVSQFQANTARIVLDLAPDVFLDSSQIDLQRVSSTLNGNIWVLRPVIASYPSSFPVVPRQLPSYPSQRLPLLPAYPAWETTEPLPPEFTPPPEIPVPEASCNINFGEPILGGRYPCHPGGRVIPTDVLLAAGSKLNLRYAGENTLTLQAGESRQEVLLLQDNLRDRYGNLIAPLGTPVIGRFQTNNTLSRFVVQAIALGGQNNLPFEAISEPLGNAKQVTQNQIIGNSALGALAVAILGGFSGGLGLLGGAVLGAATTYIVAPEAITIQPGQVLSVQLTSDFR